MPAPEFAPPAPGAPAAGPQPVAPNRRTRRRLRELCDEVLASFRVARERDLFSDGDRQDGRALVAGVLPTKRR